MTEKRGLFIPPTAKGLNQSVMNYLVTGRTTFCDLMCVTTTSVEYDEGNIHRKKFSKTLNIALPYKKPVRQCYNVLFID